MPRKRRFEPEPEEYPDVEPEEEDNLEDIWSERFEDDFPRLDDFDDLEDWLENESDWDEDKYGES